MWTLGPRMSLGLWYNFTQIQHCPVVVVVVAPNPFYIKIHIIFLILKRRIEFTYILVITRTADDSVRMGMWKREGERASENMSLVRQKPQRSRCTGPDKVRRRHAVHSEYANNFTYEKVKLSDEIYRISALCEPSNMAAGCHSLIDIGQNAKYASCWVPSIFTCTLMCSLEWLWLPSWKTNICQGI